MKRASSVAWARVRKVSSSSDTSGAIQTMLEKPLGASASASFLPSRRAVTTCPSSSTDQARNQGRRLHGGAGPSWRKLLLSLAQHQAPSMYHSSSAKYSLPEQRA
jgi:hypothetical protein